LSKAATNLQLLQLCISVPSRASLHHGGRDYTRKDILVAKQFLASLGFLNADALEI